MKIRNLDTLAVSPARQAILEIAEAGLAAIDTRTYIEAHVAIKGRNLQIKDTAFSLGDGRVMVVTVGKCAADGATALEKVLGDRISDGVALDIRPGEPLQKIRAYVGTHPFPSEANVSATKAILNLISGLTEADTVLFLISGGGSTLLCQPPGGDYELEADIVRNLFKAGADIQAINTIRKHFSSARGGNLAKAAYPARVISLVFSDVPGSDLGFIASGPTVKDTTTLADAQMIIDRYHIADSSGTHIALLETPKEDKYFSRTDTILFLDNTVALDAMKESAVALGYQGRIVTDRLTGEAREVALNIAQELHQAPHKTVLLYGGETTVTVTVPGKGGRNQELALAALSAIQSGEVIAAVASDGRDNTDFSGALCDIITRNKALEQKIDPNAYLDRNQSYAFFEAVGDYLSTGSTGSNVSDLIIALKE